MNNFLSQEELKKLGLKSFGEDVLIGRNVMIYAPEKLSIGNHVRIDECDIERLYPYLTILRYIWRRSRGCNGRFYGAVFKVFCLRGF